MKRLLASAVALSLLAAGAPAVADHGRDGKQAAKAHKHAAKAHHKAMKRAEKAWRKGQYMPSAHRGHYMSDPYAYDLRAAGAVGRVPAAAGALPGGGGLS